MSTYCVPVVYEMIIFFLLLNTKNCMGISCLPLSELSLSWEYHILEDTLSVWFQYSMAGWGWGTRLGQAIMDEAPGKHLEVPSEG